MKKTLKYFAVLCALVAISGCSKNAKKKLGLSENIPDEFQVSKTSGLDVPPHFKLHNPYESKDTDGKTDALSKDEEALLKNIK